MKKSEKKSMKKSTIIRLVVSSVMIVAAIVLGVTLDGVLTGPHTQMWQRMVFLVTVVGTGMSGLMGFFSPRGYIWGFLYMLAIAVPLMLPKPWGGVLVAAGIGAMFIRGAIVKSRAERSGTAEETEEPEEPEYTEEELRRLEQYKDKMIVLEVWKSRHYQVFCQHKQLYMYFVGTQLKGIDEGLLQSDVSNLRETGPLDIVVPLESIKKIRLNLLRIYEPKERYQVVMKTKGKKYRLTPLFSMESKEVLDFWENVVPAKTVKGTRSSGTVQDEQSEPQPLPEPGRVKALKVVKTCIGVYLGLVNLPWLFIGVPYKLFSILSLLALPVVLILYLCFPNELTVIDSKKAGRYP